MHIKTQHKKQNNKGNRGQQREEQKRKQTNTDKHRATQQRVQHSPVMMGHRATPVRAKAPPKAQERDQSLKKRKD